MILKKQKLSHKHGQKQRIIKYSQVNWNLSKVSKIQKSYYKRDIESNRRYRNAVNANFLDDDYLYLCWK